MEIKTLLDIVNYSINNYKNEEGNRFSVIDYFSLCDIKVIDLSHIAITSNRKDVSRKLVGFNQKSFLGLLDLDIPQKMKDLHSINGVVLTDEDKLTIIEKIKAEGFPLVEGIYNYVARQYILHGIDSISRDRIRDRVIQNYVGETPNKAEKEQSIRRLLKKD